MSPKLRASIRRVLFATSALSATVAYAAPQDSQTTDEIAEIVIVTGSYIRGTAEDAALPVDVISTEELEKQGAPSPVEMLKSVTVMNGIVGETNRHMPGRGQAATGATLVNMRGFGSNRTLVLLNGKRLASEDINLMPANSIARVEILKEGGASTYGSDAIGGVVNYITKERVEGLELTADFRHIEDSDGDYNGGLSWGTTWDGGDFFVAANYFHRSQLAALDRDWAVRSYAENPEGGWSAGSNPGNFRFLGGAPLLVRADPGCEFFGGARDANNNCVTQFSVWDNIVDEQNTYQAFASANFDLSDTFQLGVEAVYGKTKVPNASASPSYLPIRNITQTVAGPGAISLSTNPLLYDPRRTPFFVVPATNPGFQGAFAPGSGFVPAGAQSAYIQIVTWRPYLATGNPNAHDGTPRYAFDRESARFAAELNGEIGSVNLTTSVGYSIAESQRHEVDILTGRLQLALRGLGGPNCTGTTPGANGCLWFNPFSNALATTRTGVANPNYSASAANSTEVVNWMEGQMSDIDETRLAEFNTVLSGELPFSLPGGQMGWAAGVQYRHTWIESSNTALSDRDVTPCPDTPITGTTTCTPYGESAFNFLSTYGGQELDRGVYAGFAEMSLPVLDSVNMQLAARFEDYGDQGGSSFDPKFSVKWQIIDQLAFRAAASTTFRAPGQTQLVDDSAIGFSQILGASRPVKLAGNPELEPEESFQWSAGLIANVGNFRAMVDYWSFDIDKLLIAEPASGIASLVFPTTNDADNRCATTDQAFLDQRFVFANGVCSIANLLQINVQTINGAGLKNDGIDVTMDYTFDVGAGSLVVGGSGTWIHKYETDTLIVNGLTVEPGFDGVGYLNQGTTLFPLPEWRAQGYLDFSVGAHNVRWTANFVDQYRDQRDGIRRGDRTATNIFATNQNGRIVDSTVIHNLTYRVELPANVTLLGTIENILDEDPSFVRSELNYDPVTGQPLGRTIKLGARVSFQ